MTYLIFFLTLFNIVCWIIFFIRFKKIFSTDKIIEKTKNQMNKLVQDIDNVTDRDLYVVRESSKALRALLADADKKMAEFSQASQRLRDMIAESEKNKKSSYSFKKEEKKEPIRRTSLTNAQINSYLKNQKMTASQKASETSFEVTNAVQGELFENQTSSVLKDETTITSDGTAYKEVPLIITEVYNDQRVDEDSVQNFSNIENNEPKTLREKVIKLYNEGYKNEEIANALSCSRTEVDFIIGML